MKTLSQLIFATLLALTLTMPAPAQTPGKISLDIRDMDIVEVLKTLAGRANLNVIVGRNVSGRVTMVIADADPRDAFDTVLLANDLAYVEQGGIITVMNQADYEIMYGERGQAKKQSVTRTLKYAKAAELSKSLTLIKSGIGKIVVDEASNTLIIDDSPSKLKEMDDLIARADLPVETRVFKLDYGESAKISAKIQEMLTRGVGSLKTDDRTNKIMVTDYPARLNEIAALVTAFDEKSDQVLISAQIIEISPSDKFEMGVDWDFWLEKNFRAATSIPIGTSGRLLVGTTAGDPTGPGEYKSVLDLLRTIGDTKILSSPRIMVLNNQEAKIHVGTKDAYITSTISQGATGTAVTAQSVNFVDTGIKLFVTPTITSDGFVTMKIRPEISTATRTDITSEGQVSQIPIVTTSEAETTIRLKDGVTVVIGGLKKDEHIKTVKKIPLLGDLPFLGAAFRSTSDETTTSDLVILLTPRVVSGENSNATEVKDLASISVNQLDKR